MEQLEQMRADGNRKGGQETRRDAALVLRTHLSSQNSRRVGIDVSHLLIRLQAAGSSAEPVLHSVRRDRQPQGEKERVLV